MVRVGVKTSAEDTIMRACLRSASRARAQESVSIVLHQAISPESTPNRKRARAKASEVSKDNVTTPQRWGTQQGSTPKENHTSSEKAQERVAHEI